MTRGIPHHPPNGDHHHRQKPPSQSPYSYQQHRNYYPPSSSSRSSSCKGCCCCILLLLSFIALLLLAIFLFMVLAIKPKKPQLELQQVDVQYVGITPNDPAATATLSLSVRLLFTVKNPNRVGIRYGDSRFTIMFRGIPLGKAFVPGFYQDPHSVKNVAAAVAVDQISLIQADAAELVRDAMLSDRVEFRVLGDVSARIRVLRFNSPRVQVSVDCVIVISPRRQSLTYKQCGIDALNV